jgi:aldehyde:ferredoxin oxidoreductase
LKAIAVRGNGAFPIYDLEKYNALCKKIAKDNATSPAIAAMREYGTAQVLDNLWAMGDIPVKNWQLGIWEEGCKNLGGKKMKKPSWFPHGLLPLPPGLFPVGENRRGPYKMDGPGPSRNLGGHGNHVPHRRPQRRVFANDLCNRYGIDTISTRWPLLGMEAYEKA